MKIKNILKKINLKTIYFNLRAFSFREAIKLPVLLEKHCIVNNIYRGGVQINSTLLKPGMLQIGYIPFKNAMSSKRDRCVINIEKNSCIVLCGKASFSAGSCINVASGGQLIIGNNCSFNARTNIECHKKISFGDNVLVSWDCQFMDTDFHFIIIDNEKKNNRESVSIGNSVWICCDSIILKGSYIPDGCIIGAKSLVNKKLGKINSLYAGTPASLKKENISWKEI